MNKFSRTTRSVTFAAMCGLALTTGAVGIQSAPIAVAEEQLASLPASLIDKEATGKLILHKKADPSSSNVPTGEIDPQVTGTDLPGVGFTLYKIRDIDLYSNAGVKNAAEKMNQPKPANQYLTAGGQADLTKVTEVKQGVTDEHGMIEFSFAKGELGAYLVVETGPKPGYTPASPFIAFIPMTKNNGQDGEKGGVEWNYNVHAYPKNFKKVLPIKLSKTVVRMAVIRSRILSVLSHKELV